MVKRTKKPGIPGLSGSPGKLSYDSQQGHRVVAYVAPAPGQLNDPAGCLAERTQFQAAHRYAKAAQHDPQIWAQYQAEADRCQGDPEQLAIADYMKGPVIAALHLDAYQGRPGDQIRILATDGFRVAGVLVAITDGHQQALESGAAVYKPALAAWQYKALRANPALPGSRIRIEARDLPGNCTSLERTI